jgi:hypothetical protein
MINIIIAKIRSIVNRFGINIVRYRETYYPPDFSSSNLETCTAVQPYTMRLNLSADAVSSINHPIDKYPIQIITSPDRSNLITPK